MSQSNKEPVAGFINRGGFFPAYVIAIVFREDGCYAIYPSCDEMRIRDIKSVEDLKARETFFSIPDLFIGKGEVAIALSCDKVLIGSIEYLLRTVQEEISSRQKAGEKFDDNYMKIYELTIEDLKRNLSV